MADVSGVLVNDARGLCLHATGDLQSAVQRHATGFFSSLADAAAALSDDPSERPPVVRLETSTRVLLVSREASDAPSPAATSTFASASQARTVVVSAPLRSAAADQDDLLEEL
ncbi:hypothetical protein PINS_up007793 [Pythium insidiosum]|nr:hypothetical protein PINS_up007793 [Pythium insidiosum]